MAKPRTPASRALRFVALLGVVSLFADFSYEGGRSVLGPYLGVLGASGAVVGVVTGFGELVGFGVRLISGRAADRTRWYWPLTMAGYVINLAAVPALALAGSWPWAAVLIILERAGKAIRTPPRDVMLSHAGKSLGGVGWAFGLHQTLDQLGALIGPLVVAGVLAWRGSFRLAFAVLLVPGVIAIAVLIAARVRFPRPKELESHPPDVRASGLPRPFWSYLGGAALVGAGFADFPLLAFHFHRASIVPTDWIPVFYAVAMGASGAGSLLFGRLFDRWGLEVLVPLTIASAAFAPLAFLGGTWVALAGAAVWGLGMGVHESIMPAAVAPMVPMERRASAYGLFAAIYGLFWFLGSALLGFLYDASVPVMVWVSVALELAAIPFFLVASRSLQPIDRSE
jgi:MFS family permease